MGFLVQASTATQTNSGWPPTPHFTTISPAAVIEYSRGFGSKLSSPSTFFAQSSTLDFETVSESILENLEVFPSAGEP
jgi:hypothetical protein